MKTQFLLPFKFKKAGLYMLPLFVIMACIEVFGNESLTQSIWVLPLPSIFNDGSLNDSSWFTIVTDSIYNEIWVIGILLSLSFIALAREKEEDEMISKIRLESMAWALWAILILFAFETLFIFGFSYMEFTFLTLFIYLLLFIFKFNYEMYKVRKN